MQFEFMTASNKTHDKPFALFQVEFESGRQTLYRVTDRVREREGGRAQETRVHNEYAAGGFRQDIAYLCSMLPSCARSCVLTLRMCACHDSINICVAVSWRGGGQRGPTSGCKCLLMMESEQ